MKSAPTFCAVSLLLTACQTFPPEKRSTEAEIRQHIVGQWTQDKESDGSLFPQIFIGSDGMFAGIHSDGTKEFIGTWKLDHNCLVVNTVRTNYAVFDDGRTVCLGNVKYYPVIFASEHQLVCTPGLSMAGRYRFSR